MPSTRRGAFIFIGFLVLSACGDRAAEQATNFAALLQDRVLNQPGARLPILSDEERSKIGPYVDDFAIFKAFNDDFGASIKELGASMNPAPANVRPLDFPKYKPDLQKARAFFQRALQGLDAAVAKAEEAKAKLHQPDIVKTKFDAAFQQLVVKPANAMRTIAPLGVEAIDAEIGVAEFIESHRADLQDVGGQLATSKPAVRKQLDSLFAKFREKYAKVPEARRQLELAVEGR